MPVAAGGRRLGMVPEKVGPSKETHRRLQNGSASGDGSAGSGGGGAAVADPTVQPTPQVRGGCNSRSIIKLAVNGTIGLADLESMCNATVEHAGGHGCQCYPE